MEYLYMLAFIFIMYGPIVMIPVTVILFNKYGYSSSSSIKNIIYSFAIVYALSFMGDIAMYTALEIVNPLLFDHRMSPVF